VYREIINRDYPLQLHKYHIFRNKKNEGIKVINAVASPVMKSSLEKKGYKLIYVIDALNKDDALKIYEREIIFTEIKLTQPTGI